MAYDFEALVGHLHVVGGRSISAAPPGLLVEVAPKKAARGREADTFFILALPTADLSAPATFYEQMARLGADRYFSSGGGSVTAGLRDVFTSINQNLIEHNLAGKRRYEANLLCAVLRDNELFVSRVGSGVGLIHADSETLSFPADFEEDESIFRPPLGVHPVPDIKMTKYSVREGMRLVLADSRLTELEMEQIKAGLKAQDIANLLNEMKALITDQIALMAVEFVPPEQPSPVAAREAETTSKVVPPQPEPVVETSTSPAESAPVAEVPKRRARTMAGISLQGRRGLGAGAAFLARFFETLNRLFERLLPMPGEGQRTFLNAQTAAGAAVLIPIAVVVVVIIMWLAGTGESEFELCVEDALNTAQVARGIASSDVNGTLAAWNAVSATVGRCESIRAGDPTLGALTREAQSIIDRLFDVERRETFLISPFTNASLTKVVLNGLDLYVLDSQNQQVYRVTLTNDGRSIIPQSQLVIPSMRLGGFVQEFRVENIIDIAWAEETSTIIALDNTGLLISCSPRFIQNCEAQRLLAAENWSSPNAITIWQGRLYILDPAGNQIWRYSASGGKYVDAPAEYFTGQSRPDVRPAVDFGIDNDGSVYVLMGDGAILKFRSGAQTPFGYAGFPAGQDITSAAAMYLNSNPLGQGLFIVNRTNRTVYETTLAGSFVSSYRTFNEELFASINNVITDPNQTIIYVLSGNAVLAFDKTVPQ